MSVGSLRNEVFHIGFCLFAEGTRAVAYRFAANRRSCRTFGSFGPIWSALRTHSARSYSQVLFANGQGSYLWRANVAAMMLMVGNVY